MNRPALPALLLVALLGLAGCFGAVEPEEPEVIEQPATLEEPLVEWITPPSTIELDGNPIILQIKFQGQDWALTPLIITPTFDQVSAYGWSQTVQGYSLEFLPSMLGNYSVTVSIEPVDQESIAPIVPSLTHTIEVVEPVAQAPVLNAPVREILEEPNLLWFEGSVEHEDLDTCTMEYSVSDGSSGSI